METTIYTINAIFDIVWKEHNVCSPQLPEQYWLITLDYRGSQSEAQMGNSAETYFPREESGKDSSLSAPTCKQL